MRMMSIRGGSKRSKKNWRGRLENESRGRIL